MKTQLDKLIGSLEDGCPSCKRRLQAQVAAVAVPLAEVLGLGAAMKSLIVVLSGPAAAAIQAGAASIPMTPADVAQFRIAQTLAANANLSVFDVPQGFSFAEGMFGTPTDLLPPGARPFADYYDPGDINDTLVFETFAMAKLASPQDPCSYLREQIRKQLEYKKTMDNELEGPPLGMSDRLAFMDYRMTRDNIELMRRAIAQNCWPVRGEPGRGDFSAP